MHPLELQIAQIAGRQDNLITWEQLVRIGVGRRAVARRVENGRWQRIHKGVYLIGPSLPTFSARARAAALTSGDGAVVSHRTAGIIWALLPVASEPQLHVTVPGRNPGLKPGIRIHRVATVAAEDLTTKLGIPLTTPARTICDLAATEPLRDVESALAEARIHRLAADRQITAVIDRAPTRPGITVVRQLLEAEDDSDYTRSKAERCLRDLIKAANLTRPLFNEPILGFVVDVVWPNERLIVEVDSYTYHSHPAAFERDRRRDQQLVAAGYRVIRITWIQLRDRPIETIASIIRALG